MRGFSFDPKEFNWVSGLFILGYHVGLLIGSRDRLLPYVAASILVLAVAAGAWSMPWSGAHWWASRHAWPGAA